MEPTTW